MPYTTLGEGAKWAKPQNVLTFYEQVQKRIAGKLKRKVEMRVEKDAPKSGLVIGEMFKAIRDADIFIADVTGSNCNVFLELGVRYGVSDKVTIITTQDDTPPPFDINQIAAVRYADGPTQAAERRIAEIVQRELGTNQGGSPILDLLDATIVPREQWRILCGERIQLMIHDARQQSELAARLELLRAAVDLDPLSLPARLELMQALRNDGQLDSALAANDDAMRRFPRSAPIFKERGRIMDRISSRGEDRLEEAISAFSVALAIAERDPDLHGCLGGVFRRKALRSKGTPSIELLDTAFDHYLSCLSLDRYSTYAGMNLMRLIMLGAKPRKELGASEEQYLNRMFYLCSFEVSDTECVERAEKWWHMFDLADILLLRGEVDQAIQTYSDAIDLIPGDARQDLILSPLRTWKELIESGCLRKPIDSDAERVVQLLEQHLGSQPLNPVSECA